MKNDIVAVGAAMVLAIGGLAAVASAQNPTAPAAARGRVGVAPVPNEVTVTGCVELETDYRKRMAAGRGGVLGSGVGATDEFVLTNVRPTTSEGARGVGTGGRSGNAGATSGGGVYSLTGPQETNLKREINRQVQVVGVIENAGKSSTGADVKDISDLPRIAITTWNPIADFCPGTGGR